MKKIMEVYEMKMNEKGRDLLWNGRDLLFRGQGR
jgi:hypothetical protein